MDQEILRLGALLGLLALPLSAWASPRLAGWLGARQHIRPAGPLTHSRKAGTPTMGGLVLLLCFFGAGVLVFFCGLGIRAAFVLFGTALAGAVGLLDDLRAQRRGRNTGLFPHQTILAQTLAALILVGLATLFPQTLRLPFSSRWLELPAWGWIPLLVLAFLGTVNGVNLADGLDGLATGLWVVSLLGLIPALRSWPEHLALTFVGLGAGLGFLWANAHPARVFLGNVGSMALGGFLFGLSWSAGAGLFLPIVGGVFVLEALSVILQVGSYKLTGVRLFKMSPLHHHLEDGSVTWPHRLRSPNWPEPQVVTRLWILGGACALLGALAALFP